MAYSRPTASNMKSPQKSQIVTSDNYELTFVLSEQVFEVSSISSHTGAQPSTPHNRVPGLVQTRQGHAAIRRRCSSHVDRKFLE